MSEILKENNKAYKTCTRCIYDERSVSISFDDKGVCNICNQIDELKITILACYFPIIELAKEIPLIKTHKSTNTSFNELLKLQLFYQVALTLH